MENNNEASINNIPKFVQLGTYRIQLIDIKYYTLNSSELCVYLYSMEPNNFLIIRSDIETLNRMVDKLDELIGGVKL
jgi:hypothetical protein